jgi:hypothetical protein
MNKEFVPYEQALALKELGFDASIFGYYYTLNGKDWKFADDKQYDALDEFYNIGSKFTISAPLYQQAFRFFREKYNIHIRIEKYDETKWWANWGSWTSEVYEIYEEAELACLIKLIEIVKII